MSPWIKSFLLIGLVLSLSANAFGQDISFQASVDRKKAGLDSTIILDLTATGVQNTSPVDLPEIDGFKSRYIGPSTSVSIVNGQYSSSVSQKYILYPQKVGTWTIPAFRVTIDGKQYETQPIEVEILESAPAEHPGSSVDVSRPANLEDKAFLKLEFSKEKVYVHERLPITIKLYAANISLTDIQFPVLAHSDLVFEDFGKPTQYQDVVGGVAYDVVEFTTGAYPAKDGSLALDQVRLDCNVVYKRPSRGSSMFDGFSDDLFGDFFGGYEKYPVTLRSQAHTLEVLPLPSGAPQGFGSAVGQFDLQMSVSPLEVNVGDPVAIKMILSGSGDLKTIEMPAYQDAEDFKVYDPQIKQQGNVKTLEQVLIPKTEKMIQVPETVFVYFDPQKESYETIKRGPFTITVHPALQEKKEIVDVGKGTEMVPETLGRDIVFIKENPGVFYPAHSMSGVATGFWMFLILYVLGVAVGWFFFRRNIRMKTDTHYAKRLRAPQKAREGLRAAENFMRSHRSKEFYDVAYKVLQKYFAEKFSIPEGMITAHDIQGILLKYNVPLTMIGRVQGLFSACEAIRYGAVVSDAASLQKNYETLKEVLDFFERMSP